MLTLSSKLFVRSFHRGPVCWASHIEVTPSFGDSISEGVIAKWLKVAGDPVAPDEAVLVVDTDKLSVEIKSTMGGVFKRNLAGDVAFVGKPLFELETDGTSSIPQKNSEIAASKNSVGAPQETHASHPRKRVPLIKFLGKRSLLKNSHSTTSATSPVTNKVPTSVPLTTASKPHSPNAVDFTTLKDGAWFGRPKLSAVEMDAIESGGATISM